MMTINHLGLGFPKCRSAASRIRATAPKAAREAIEAYLNTKFVTQAGL